MTRAELDQLQADWDRAERIRRLRLTIAAPRAATIAGYLAGALAGALWCQILAPAIVAVIAGTPQ